MILFALGLNHTTAPLAVRERLAFTDEQVSFTVKHLCDRLGSPQMGGIAEAAILSTCNRTEFYIMAQDAHIAKDALVDYLSECKGITASELKPHLYFYTQADVAKHMFRVVSGLDSMVLGETQITGQLKKAHDLAKEAQTLGTMLNHLFQTSLTVSKEIRSVTQIGANSISLAAAAVKLALRLFGQLSQERVLFVGAGEMIELCGKHFAAQNPKSITVANRTLEKGQALAQELGGNAIRLADLPHQFHEYDIIVSCTASSLPIIGLGMVERAISLRKHRPMFIVDLAVPRDVEVEIERLEDVYVYTVDDLGKVVTQGMASRQAAITQAETIIELRKRDFEAWLRTRDSVPAIQSLRDRANYLRDFELKRARRHLKHGDDPDEVLEMLAYGLTNKLVHDPTVLLREGEGLTPEERALVEQILNAFYRRFDH